MTNIKLLKEISDEVDKIFIEITENDNLSLDELDELSRLNEYLNFRLNDYVEDYNKELIEIYNKLKSKIAISKLYMFFSVLVSFLLLINISPISLFGIVLINCISIRVLHNLKEKDKYINKLCEDIENLQNKMHRLIITMDNNEKQIFKQQKNIYTKNINDIKKDKNKIIKIKKANELIQKYISFEIFPTNENDEIRELATKMLQLDLNSNNPSLEYLLIEAKEKVKNDESNLTRKL